MLFAIDHGNSAIKTPNFEFTSGLAEYLVRPPLETDILEYDGKFWVLSGQRISYMRDKTRDERYFILPLFAIAKELRNARGLPPMVEADLAVGLPPEHYGALRAKFAEYFKRGAVKFVFNGTPCCVVFRQVLVFPQAYAAVVPRAQTLKEALRTFIIDIGGYTTDVLLLRNARPDLQFCRSLEMGVITMANDIVGKVSALHDLKIEDDHIADVLQGRPTILSQEVRDTIFASVREHANSILDKLRELQVDLRANPAIFIGGGSVLYQPFIEESPMLSRQNLSKTPRPMLEAMRCWPLHSSARRSPRMEGMALFSDNKFRFSLQWGPDSEEKVQAGRLLEKLGNKKSEFIVLAVTEYIREHPEVVSTDGKISITVQPTQTADQLQAMVREMAMAAVTELMAGMTLVPASPQNDAQSAGPSQDDLDDMLKNLDIFK